MKRPLHLYDTWGLRIVHGFESGLVSLEGGVTWAKSSFNHA